MKLNTTYIDNINKELQAIDEYLDIKIAKYENALQEDLVKFSEEIGIVISAKLNDIRARIISWLKPTLKVVTDKIAAYQEIVDLVEVLVGLNVANLADLLTIVPKIVILIAKTLLLQYTKPLEEALELQIDIASKVIELSDNIQSIVSKDFNIPNMPPPTITVQPITLGDLA